jgi:hypothetical protein
MRGGMLADPIGLVRLRSASAALAVATLALGAGVFLAWHHPLWPVIATSALALWTIAAARYRGLWLVVLPAALPLLDFSPWTGWLAFDEFDLLALGALAGGYARVVWQASVPSTDASPAPGRQRCSARVGFAFALVGLALLGLFRGVIDAGGWTGGWFGGYAQASNSLRVSKSLVYAAAFWPLVRNEFARSTPHAASRLARGMQVGLTIVGLLVLWERAAYPGLLDFSTPYRTTAAFWEMHVGGAAIDAYLALATPFSAWALISARSRLGWAAAALLALLTAHAVLTTFSRGAYVGVAVPLAWVGAAWWRYRRDPRPRVAARAVGRWVLFACGSTAVLILAHVAFGYVGMALALLVASIVVLTARWRTSSLYWRRSAATVLVLTLLAEVVAVFAGGTFIRSRLEASGGDFGARLKHWRSGLELLAGPADWALGIGAGRLPPRYAKQVSRGEFSGSLELVPSTHDTSVVRLSGPATVDDLAGLFALTQRVPIFQDSRYVARLRVRVAVPTVLAVDVCEQHLLYPRECQGALVTVTPHDGAWQSISTPLEGPGLDPGPWYARRLGVFSLSVQGTGTTVELAEIGLQTADRSGLLRNGDFAAGLARWFPKAESHFLPWHIDNLYLELLIERGVLGLAVVAAMLVVAFRNLLSVSRPALSVATVLVASLFGLLLVGSISSVMDIPRISLLFLLLIACSIQVRARCAPTVG